MQQRWHAYPTFLSPLNLISLLSRWAFGLSGFVRYVLNNLLQIQSTDCDQSCLADQNTYELFGMGEELDKKLGGSFLDELFSMCEDLGKNLEEEVSFSLEMGMTQHFRQ